MIAAQSLRATQTLNFILAGQARCGGTLLQTSINAHPEAVCHGDLLHEVEAVRQTNHEGYFGPPPDPQSPTYFNSRILSPEHYLSTRIFDNPLWEEAAVGVKLLYQQLYAYDLWDYCQSRCRAGDFCLIHVTRNPVACFVSLQQAKQSGVWTQDFNDRSMLPQPDPVWLVAKDLTAFCRAHTAHEAKLRQFCDDRLEISYRELFLNYREVMEGVFRFLSLTPYYQVTPGTRRLKNRLIPDRISNFERVRAEVPQDVRDFFDADDLF